MPDEPETPDEPGPEEAPARTDGWDGWTPRPDPGALASATSLEELERKLDEGELDAGADE